MLQPGFGVQSLSEVCDKISMPKTDASTRRQGFSSSRSPPIMATTYGPFAKILLALSALREKKPEVARAQLNELVAEFPENPVFASELAKLKASPAAAIPHQK